MKTAVYSNINTAGFSMLMLGSWTSGEWNGVPRAIGFALIACGGMAMIAERRAISSGSSIPSTRKSRADINATLYTTVGSVLVLGLIVGFGVGYSQEWSADILTWFAASWAALCLLFVAGTTGAYRLAEAPEELSSLYQELRRLYPKLLALAALIAFAPIVAGYWGKHGQYSWKSAMPGIVGFLVFAIVFGFIVVDSKREAVVQGTST